MKQIIICSFTILIFSCKKNEDFTCREYQIMIQNKKIENNILQVKVDSLLNELKKADVYIDMLEYPIIENEK